MDARILSVGANLFLFLAASVIGDVARSARLRAVRSGAARVLILRTFG